VEFLGQCVAGRRGSGVVRATLRTRSPTYCGHGRAHGASFFGASPTYVNILEKQASSQGPFRLDEAQVHHARGSPVTAESWRGATACEADAWTYSGSGGTDLCSGIVGGVALQPFMPAKSKGAAWGAAFAFKETGERW